jgi:hypothetical protein
LIVVGDHRQMLLIVKHDWDTEARRTFRGSDPLCGTAIVRMAASLCQIKAFVAQPVSRAAQRVTTPSASIRCKQIVAHHCSIAQANVELLRDLGSSAH